MSLYKYYAPDSFDFICVEGGVSARFSQPSVLNDVFELSEIITEERKQETITSNRYIKMIPTEIKNPISRAKRTKSIYDKKFGVFSVSKKSNSRCMWSYYCEDNSGFMITFKGDIKLPIIQSENNEVNYENERIPEIYERTREKSPDEIRELYQELLFRKDDDWTHEGEYRFIALLEDIEAKKTDSNGFPIHCLKIPPSDVEAITLGVRSSEALTRKAIFWIQSHAPNVKLFKAAPCTKYFKLNYERIEI